MNITKELLNHLQVNTIFITYENVDYQCFFIKKVLKNWVLKLPDFDTKFIIGNQVKINVLFEDKWVFYKCLEVCLIISQNQTLTRILYSSLHKVTINAYYLLAFPLKKNKCRACQDFSLQFHSIVYLYRISYKTI